LKNDVSAARCPAHARAAKTNGHMMTYPSALNDNLPIGSGVTEAACKTLVKQRTTMPLANAQVSPNIACTVDR
jgi:hypothetical protein